MRASTVPLDAASIAGAQSLSVANIDSPTELNSRIGTAGQAVLVYQTVAGNDQFTWYAYDTASSAGVNSPYVLAASGSGFWIAVAGKYCNSAELRASTVSATQLISTIATGTAPLTVTSTTVVPNLNVSQLLGSTWAVPAAIGSTTPAAGTFSALTVSGAATFSARTAARVPFFGTAGLLSDSTDMTFASASGTLTLGNATASHVISSTTASTSTATGALIVSGGVGIAKGMNAGATSSVNAGNAESRFTLGDPANNTSSFSSLRMHAGSTRYSFQFGSQINVNQAFEITPSTAVGGTTFTNPAIVVFGATGNTALGTTTDDATNKLQVTGGIIASGNISFSGATSASLKMTTATANAAVATTLGSVGPTGSTAGNPLGWVRINVAGTDRYIPFW